MATGKQWVTFIHLLVLVAVAFPGHCLSGDWTWVSGTGLVNQVGIYGTKGVGAGSNVPSARSNSATWRDGLGRFWLFGGIVGRQPNFTAQDLYNDLWRFDGTNWTWVSCSKTAGAVGNYGTKGVAAATNVPGARTHAVTWTENNGFLWLFGGSSAVAQDTMKIWNDLWKFDGVNWTWVSGSNVANGAASYGTKGVAASTNVPGARLGSVTWRDNANKLWLFGGMRNGNTTIDHGLMNDLWKFDGVNWIWVSGANTAAGTVSTAVYGTKGLASATNIPGGRTDAVSWVDSNNYLWLFGGKGVDSSGNAGTLNDLWRYNVATNQWTWISGANVIQQTALYGTKGVPSSTARPGCRVLATAWTDSSNNLWLFGGLGSAVAGTVGWLNDLWKFDGTYWTWVSGSNTYAEQGTYGIKGVSATSNVPGARMLGNVFSSDDKTSLWLFGGWGVDGGGKGGQLNDLWKFTP